MIFYGLVAEYQAGNGTNICKRDLLLSMNPSASRHNLSSMTSNATCSHINSNFGTTEEIRRCSFKLSWNYICVITEQ